MRTKGNTSHPSDSAAKVRCEHLFCHPVLFLHDRLLNYSNPYDLRLYGLAPAPLPLHEISVCVAERQSWLLWQGQRCLCRCPASPSCLSSLSRIPDKGLFIQPLLEPALDFLHHYVHLQSYIYRLFKTQTDSATYICYSKDELYLLNWYHAFSSIQNYKHYCISILAIRNTLILLLFTKWWTQKILFQMHD